MKNSINFKVLYILIGSLGLPGVAQAVSLLEVYQQALQSDPRIHDAEARRLAARDLLAVGVDAFRLGVGNGLAAGRRDRLVVVYDQNVLHRSSFDVRPMDRHRKGAVKSGDGGDFPTNSELDCG